MNSKVTRTNRPPARDVPSAARFGRPAKLRFPRCIGFLLN
jgi:hypothetical protein